MKLSTCPFLTGHRDGVHRLIVTLDERELLISFVKLSKAKSVTGRFLRPRCLAVSSSFSLHLPIPFSTGSAANVPSLFPNFGMNPYSETNSLGALAASSRHSLHRVAGEGFWGRGRRLRPLPQTGLEKPSPGSHRSHRLYGVE